MQRHYLNILNGHPDGHGEWVKWADAEAEYDHGVIDGMKIRGNAAVQREREEIIVMLGDLREKIIPDNGGPCSVRRFGLTTAIEYIRARGEGKPVEWWEKELPEKPAKIARLAVKGSTSDWDIDTLTLAMKLNELIDRENARG
jgi:hypothetical protein